MKINVIPNINSSSSKNRSSCICSSTDTLNWKKSSRSGCSSNNISGRRRSGCSSRSCWEKFVITVVAIVLIELSVAPVADAEGGGGGSCKNRSSNNNMYNDNITCTTSSKDYASYRKQNSQILIVIKKERVNIVHKFR